MMAHDDGNQGMFGDEEWALVRDAELRAIVNLYAESKGDFLKEFASAWAYLMTVDRCDGLRANACNGVSTPTRASSKSHKSYKGHKSWSKVHKSWSKVPQIG